MYNIGSAFHTACLAYSCIFHLCYICSRIFHSRIFSRPLLADTCEILIYRNHANEHCENRKTDISILSNSFQILITCSKIEELIYKKSLIDDFLLQFRF